jgi:glycosyltransferase involved in cell wall biosynthesis
MEQVAMPAILRRLNVAVHHAPYFAVPYASPVPIVLTVHDLFPYQRPSNARSRTTAAAYRMLIPLAIRRARIVVAVSSFAARQLRDAFGLVEDRLRVIEHGVDHDRWRAPAAAFAADVCARHNLPEDYLLYVGTLKRHKNLATVLAAHRAEHPPLVLAGASEADLADSGLVPSQRSAVIAVGRVSDRELAALYACARALVLPSLYEAVGFTALEAMACGAPVVCSDGGGLPDTVGDAALVVPALDVAAWTHALTVISEQETVRQRLIAAGHELVRQRNWEAAASSYRDIYREAAE